MTHDASGLGFFSDNTPSPHRLHKPYTRIWHDVLAPSRARQASRQAQMLRTIKYAQHGKLHFSSISLRSVCIRLNMGRSP